jgi:hypothetical protein
MADHVRKQLRAALTTALTGLATTGSSVYGYRVHPLQAADLPCISIQTPSESGDAITAHAPYELERVVQVDVVGHAKAQANVDATLDDIAKEVETALGAAVTVSGKSVQLFYRGCEIDFAATDTNVSVITLHYEAKLYTASNAPDALN